MDNLNEIVGHNLVVLRKEKKLTQQELADEIGYGYKSISKWELGKALPTVDILKDFADYYGVSVDFLLTKDAAITRRPVKENIATNRNKILILAMSVTFIILVATCIYVNSLLTSGENLWIIFLWSIPVSLFVVAALYWLFYGRKLFVLITLSSFTWTLLFTISLQFYFYQQENVFFILLVGIPIQIVLVLAHQIKRIKSL